MSLRAVVVGAGFGGIAAAVRLVEAGVDDVVLLEARGGVGGVWRANDYPGVCCDVAAPLYSYSFAPNPHWSRRFPPRAEIAAYLDGVVDAFDLRRRIRLGREVTAADWDDATRTWAVRTAGGEDHVADLLVVAVGQLSRPRMPDLPGLADFAGRAVHTASWTADVAVRDRRVAVIGTGASAVQLVPEVARQAARVTVFQRSAPWTLPKPDRVYGSTRRALARRWPHTMLVGRGATWALTQVMGTAMTGNPVVHRAVRTVSTAHRRLSVRGAPASLRAAVEPDYPFGCKRVLFTSSWYPALRRPTVDLVTTPVERITAHGVRTVDGRTHPADLLALSTGFDAVDLVAPMQVTGRDGLRLADVWAEGAHAYLGLTVPGFPNLFLVYGPNTNTGNTSVVYFHEAQAGYIAQAGRILRAHRGGALEVRRDVEARYDREIQSRLSHSVWTACTSWYRAPNGRVVTNWPGMAREYARRTARFDLADYHVHRPRGAGP
jgi:cation diffusion facilitator CzcD-associated flavoprotein CzcO